MVTLVAAGCSQPGSATGAGPRGSTSVPAVSGETVATASASASSSASGEASEPEDLVWVAGGGWNASVVAVSPVSGRAVSVAPRTGSVCWISQDAGQVWVVTDLGSSSTVSTVSRVDSRTGQELAHGTTGSQVSGMATDRERLWLAVGSEVVAFDRRTLDPLADVHAPEPLVGLVWDGRLLWSVGARSNTLFGLDPDTGATRVTHPLGFAPPEVGGLAVDGRHLWVADGSGNRVVEVDPSTGRVLATVGLGARSLTDPTLGGNVMGMVRVRDRLWAYHLRATDRWELTPVNTSTATVAGTSLAMPSIGLCGTATDGKDLWFGWMPPHLADVGIYKADLQRLTISRVAGLRHSDAYDLLLGP